VTDSIPLFNRFPLFSRSLPYLSIGAFPTPIDPLAGLSRKLGRKNLFMKRDDISGPVYGGNKVRKLEFLLADAKKQGAVRVITNGAAGSNHALATALYAKLVGLKATLVLSEQVPAKVVCDNLLADAWASADLVYVEHFSGIAGVIEERAGHYEKTEGRRPYLIPTGGSSPLGALGFVNAAFELKEQVEQGAVPEPAAIVVAFGTMGTAAGLLLGLKAAGLGSKLIAARVVPSVVADRDKFVRLFNEMNGLLKKADPSFPVVPAGEDDIAIVHDYYEPGYGVASEKVIAAIETLGKTDGVHLDITYSGKAFAAFYGLAENSIGQDKPLLFWNTKNSRALPAGSEKIDFHTLPAEFHKYFEAK
jgi:1-aminocyclopropane-1-carboxylate deaminase/D-cysteine desulfhydrase-like pyridoxal-dependent ACC family enzyme